MNIVLEIKGEELKKKLNIRDGKDGKNSVIDYEKIIDESIARIPLPTNGYTPVKGKDYFDGESVDEKALIKKVIKEVLKRLPEIDTMNQHGYASGGANAYTLQALGATLPAAITTLNFDSGITASYSGGVLTLTSSGGGGSGYQAVTSGTVDGTNATFVFATAPNAICVDGIIINKVGDGITAGWTGTTTVVLTIAPTMYIFAIA